MPVINPKPTAKPVTPIPNTVEITKPEYKGVVTDTRYKPQSNLLTHVEGSSWTVNYYRQVLGDDNAAQGQNVTGDPIHQQYELIKKFILKVTSPLTPTQEGETSEFLATGEANVMPSFVPNVGDMFLADIGDGREGVFRVNASVRKSLMRDAIYTIEYGLVDYATDIRRGDLNQKTVKVFYFIKDFHYYGQDTLIEEEQYNQYRQLMTEYNSISSLYFTSFRSKEFRTLIVPGQPLPVYDHFLMKGCAHYFSVSEHPLMQHLRIINCDDDDSLRCFTIWDLIATRDTRLEHFVAKKTGLISANTFTRNPRLEGVYFTGIRFVVYPADPILSIDQQLFDRKKMLDPTTIQPPAIQPFVGTLEEDEVPLIHPVLIDDYYVLSQAFYEQTAPSQSKLEIQLRLYLEGKALDNTVLLSLCSAWSTWGALERFYYTPILLVLIKASIRSM